MEAGAREWNVEGGFQVQLEEDGGGSAGQSWMETSCLWPMLHLEWQGISQEHTCCVPSFDTGFATACTSCLLHFLLFANFQLHPVVSDRERINHVLFSRLEYDNINSNLFAIFRIGFVSFTTCCLPLKGLISENGDVLLQLLMSGQLAWYFYHCSLRTILYLKPAMTWKLCHRSLVCSAPKNCRPLLSHMVILHWWSFLLEFASNEKL